MKSVTIGDAIITPLTVDTSQELTSAPGDAQLLAKLQREIADMRRKVQ